MIALPDGQTVPDGDSPVGPRIVGTFTATGADRGEVFYGVPESAPVLFE